MDISDFRQALLRPILLFGGEREITLVTLLLAGTIAYAGFLGQSLLIMVAGIFLGIVGISICREMAKTDPHQVRVFIRHIKYAKFYPARSTPWRLN